MRKCEWCQKEVLKKQNLFCNINCYKEWNRSYQVKKNCIVCFKEYQIPICRDKISKCCSKECRSVLAGQSASIVNSQHTEYVSIKCLQCIKTFKLKKSKSTWEKNGTSGKRKFCCKICQLQYRKDNSKKNTIICSQCGKEKSVKPYQKNSIYCSRQCKWDFEKTLKGEKSPKFKHGFKIYRREALKLFDYKCSHCGIKHRRLHVHHIDGDNKNNNPSNWTILCPKCHRHSHLGLIALHSSLEEPCLAEPSAYHVELDA